jgi:hypothetical protein
MPTADTAMMAFHQAREQLVQDRVIGELQVVHHHGDETRTVLRESLS